MLVDPLGLARIVAGGASTIRLGGVSPLRMMFINPRKYFNPDEEFNYSLILKKVAEESIKEFAANIIAANVPGGNVFISAVQQLVPSFLKNSEGAFYAFYINPQTMKVSHSKITQETLTGGGWDFDVLGDQLSSYSFSGTSGSMLHEAVDITTIRLSRAFFKFIALEQFYLYNNNDPLLIVLDTTAYVGKLINFNWNWDANDIYQIKFDFTVRVQPKFTFDITSGAGITTLFNSTILREMVFEPAVQSGLFVTGNGSVDAYEEEMRLYRKRELEGSL